MYGVRADACGGHANDGMTLDNYGSSDEKRL